MTEPTSNTSNQTVGAEATNTAPDVASDATSTAATNAAHHAATRHRGRRRGRMVAVGVAAAALVMGGAGVAVAAAHKSVSLDVDGRITQVSTFTGSVEGLLAAEGVRLGEHDVVSPAPDARLTDGADVVVRFGRQLTLESEGGQSQVWVAALDAGEALSRLASRGDDVRLVASRSGERVSLPIRVAADGGAVEVRADGKSHTVTDTGAGVEALLAAAGVEVDDDDLVGVETATTSAARAALVVQRVDTQEVATETAVPFTRVEQEDPDRYEDLDPKVVQEGVDGVQTLVERVTTVDGVETDRVAVSDELTVPPVDEVVAVGTRERPAEPEPAPTTSATAPAETPAPAAPTGDVWAALAQCESGGRVDAVSANGLYYGLYQFSLGTWQSVGGTGLPSEASAEEQTARAQALQARSGWGQWPHCSSKLGLR